MSVQEADVWSGDLPPAVVGSHRLHLDHQLQGQRIHVTEVCVRARACVCVCVPVDLQQC